MRLEFGGWRRDPSSQMVRNFYLKSLAALYGRAQLQQAP